MRSRAFTVFVLRYARQVLVADAGTAADASVLHSSSAPARPSASLALRRKSPPAGPPVDVMKKLNVVVGASAVFAASADPEVAASWGVDIDPGTSPTQPVHKPIVAATSQTAAGAVKGK